MTAAPQAIEAQAANFLLFLIKNKDTIPNIEPIASKKKAIVSPGAIFFPRTNSHPMYGVFADQLVQVTKIPVQNRNIDPSSAKANPPIAI